VLAGGFVPAAARVSETIFVASVSTVAALGGVAAVVRAMVVEMSDEVEATSCETIA